MDIILCGYNLTGCKVLEELSQRKDVGRIYVYTHKSEAHLCNLEEYCIDKNIKYTLDKISIENLPFKPDCIISIYYRYIISKDVIDAVDGKIMNLHPSLLPKYRGCSSLTWALINGENEIGFTYHYIDEGCDTGNIILQEKMFIYDFDTQQSLYNRAMLKSVDYFTEAFEKLISGYSGVVQDHDDATYYKRGCPHNGEINDKWSVAKIKRFIRAMVYPPYPYAKYKGVEITNYSDYKKLRNEKY